MRRLLFFCVFIVSVVGYAQEFNSEVIVNAEQTGQTQLSIFQTLETSLEEFINKNKWTDIEYLPQERVRCSFFITVSTYNNNIFEASIQVQASRPVYNSGYTTPIANFNDKDFSFEYLEYQPLVFNPNGDQGNLMSVISYYIFTILGLEADTFKERGGTEYFQQAKQIVNIAQTSSGAGWQPSSGQNSRYRYNDDILSGIFNDYRDAMYKYHLNGLDVMESDAKEAKKTIVQVIEDLEQLNNKRKNTYVLRSFFDAKYNEIGRILSGGPKENIGETLDILKNIAPTYNQDWNAITQ